MPHRFDRGEFHSLVICKCIARFIAQNDDRKRRRKAKGRRHRERPARHGDMAALEQVEGRDTEDEHRRRHIAGADGVDELGLRHRVEQHRGKVGDFHPHRLRVEDGADRMLHPAIGDKDPQRRNVRPQGDHERGEQMAALRQFVPAKDHQANEGGFKEERHQPFDRQWRAEDVADIVREIRPVGAEFELHGQAGGDTQDEVDRKDLAPEARHRPPDRPVGHHIDRFHDDQHERQAERQRHEQEVIQRGQRKLEPGKFDDGHVHHEQLPLPARMSLASDGGCVALQRRLVTNCN